MAKPKDKGFVDFCENTVISVAQTLDKDQAIIRALPHKSTKVAGQYVKDKNHLTADLIDSTSGDGFAAHIYVDDDNTRMLDQTEHSPNPTIWRLKKKY
ncbi:hypothetical protein POJ06DRAFT_266981 [Lipomyces tetrasporus]|uniref:Uncharacterized protein n=1 Tax=Lipomyces tetrasporus TaxID=54092 RepID=A0AAD7QW79_9ASCO|nr:uncharacterized protein POJ06DRAFT_266981 [Lipomyces tetrasporus]KAJ8102376.1 hypothetical protein POJ06DRAFT_266981 [Lipomyces tetrasporus]